MNHPARLRTTVPTLISALLIALSAAPALAGYQPVDIAVSMSAAPDPGASGGMVSYTITVTNPDLANSAFNITLSDTIPTNTTFASFASPGSGFSCTTPAVGSGGAVSCTGGSLGANTNAVFTLVVTVDAIPPSTLLSNTATITSAFDPNAENNSATSSTTAPVSLQSFDVG